MNREFAVCLFLLLLVAHVGWGQIPQNLSYQGILTDASGTVVPDGNYNLTFKIYDVATGGTQLWSETQTDSVVNGIFNVILGSFNPLTLPFDKPYWLDLSVDAGAELTPRSVLTATAYSLNARSVEDGAVTGTKIADGSVVRSINTLTDHINLMEGENITINQSGDSLVISASGGGGGDITAVNAGDGLYGGGPTGEVTLSAGAGVGIAVFVDSISLDTSYTDMKYVNENQPGSISNSMIQDNAVSADKISPHIVSSLDGVSNDGGNIDLIGGTNVTITPDDANNSITIDATAAGGGNTLDQAYDQGGPGMGRTITADAGAVNIGGPDGLGVTGNVGIGTTNPAAKTHIKGGGTGTSQALLVTNSANQVNVTLFDNGNLGLGDQGPDATLEIVKRGTTDLLNLSSSTSADGDLVTVTNNGKVGIGNSSPTTKLEVLEEYAFGIAIQGKHSSGNYGYFGSSDYGVYGLSTSSHGVYGETSTSLSGVYGYNSYNGNHGYLGGSSGVHGEHSATGNYGRLGAATWGVVGSFHIGPGVTSNYGYVGSISYGVYGHISSESGYGVYGKHGLSDNYGYLGSSSFGVYGENSNGNNGYVGGGNRAIEGKHATTGNWGYFGSDLYGAAGIHNNSGNYGRLGTSSSGVHGQTSVSTGKAVSGYSTASSGANYGGYFSTLSIDGIGVYGVALNPYAGYKYGGYFDAKGTDGTGVLAWAEQGGAAVRGTNVDGFCSGELGQYSSGVTGYSGINGIAVQGINPPGYAGLFDGDVGITGTLIGGKLSSVIDHPQDPQNKLLRQNYVESPLSLWIYSDKVKLDASGEAVVELPDYFSSLTNEEDAIVILTSVGKPFLVGYEWQSDFISFKIYGESNREVSWVVYAERTDPIPQRLSHPVEEEKGPNNKICERGKLLYPTAYGFPESMGKNFKKREEMKKRNADYYNQYKRINRNSVK